MRGRLGIIGARSASTFITRSSSGMFGSRDWSVMLPLPIGLLVRSVRVGAGRQLGGAVGCPRFGTGSARGPKVRAGAPARQLDVRWEYGPPCRHGPGIRKPRVSGAFGDAGGGTRTPDTRIMIPLL